MSAETYEKVWIALSFVVLAVFLAAISFSVLAHGISLPGVERRLDPRRIVEEPPFNEPGVREVSPGRYEVYMVARIWTFLPNEIRIPAGSSVTFYVTSPDVIHGLHIQGTNLNVMVLPGQVVRATAFFSRPGEHLLLCHEYCGIAHHLMAARVIVEEKT